MTEHRRPKVLLVDDDPTTVETLVAVLVRALNARITCVPGPEDGLDVDILEPHDLLLAEVNVPGSGGIVMAKRFIELRRRPVILTSNDPDLGQAVAAIRAGAVDFFVKPFDVECVIASVQRALDHAEEQRQQVHRHHRLRQLLRRVIRERRELDQRVDLICRDLVGAHRRLVHRFLERQHSQT